MMVTFFPVIPVWWMLPAVVGLLVLLAHGSAVLRRKRVPWSWVFHLGALRLLAVGLFVGCLLRPVVTTTRTDERREDLLILADTSASMSDGDGVGDHDRPRPSRLHRVLEIAREQGLLASMAKSFNVRWFTFDHDARRLDDSQIANVTAGGETTSFSGGVASAWRFTRRPDVARTNAPGAATHVLLVTDGHDRGADSVVDMATELGVTLHTLAVADPKTPGPSTPVVVIGVQSPPRVLFGSQCRFRVSLRRAGTGFAQEVALELHEEGARVQRQNVAFAADQREREIELAHRPTAVGDRRYSVRACATDESTPCATATSHEMSVQVRGRPHQVMVLEDTWRWEFRFLRRIFEDDPSFSFTAFLSRGSGMYMQVAERDRVVTMAGFPRSGGDLQPFDVMILGDVLPMRWEATLVPAIRELVVDRGGSLIVIAGPNLARWSETPELAALLPVELSAESGTPITGPIHVTTAAAGISAMFEAPRDPSSAGIFADLPPVDQVYPPLRKRAAATILLEARDHSNNDGPIIVMAEQTVGRGRVLFIGTDTLWKWQMLGHVDDDGNTPYRVFWQQALRAMAPERSFRSDAALWLRTDRGRYLAGQTVRLLAELEGGPSATATDVVGTMTYPDDRKVPLRFRPDPDRPGNFVTQFEVVGAGRHAIQVAAKSRDHVVAEVDAIIDVDEAAGRETPAPTDRAMLRRIASATGGLSVDPTEPQSWPKPHRAEPRRVQVARTIDLWGGFHLVLLLVAVLTLDWIIRLVRGFV